MAIMGISLNPADYYRKGASFLKSFIKPSTLDYIEKNAATIAKCAFVAGAVAVSASVESALTAFLIANKALQPLSEVAWKTKSSAIDKELYIAFEESAYNPRSMLIVRTTNDPDGAYTTHSSVARHKHFAKTHAIDLISGSKKTELQNNMNLIQKKYDKIVVQGHGNPNAISLCEDGYLGKNSSKMLQFIRDHLNENGRVVLESCSTARGHDNIAYRISRSCPNALVYASNSEIDGISGLEYDEHCDPSFNSVINGEKIDTTVIYRNGAQIYILKP